MPIYEYVCNKCNDSFEKMESINNTEVIKKCEKCGGEAHRIISNSAFHLKGGGWYTSDYKKPTAAEKPAGCPSKTDSPACSGCAAAK